MLLFHAVKPILRIIIKIVLYSVQQHLLFDNNNALYTMHEFISLGYDKTQACLIGPIQMQYLTQ